MAELIRCSCGNPATYLYQRNIEAEPFCCHQCLPEEVRGDSQAYSYYEHGLLKGDDFETQETNML